MPCAHSNTAPVPDRCVAALTPLSGAVSARGFQVPHLEPAQSGGLLGLDRHMRINDRQCVCFMPLRTSVEGSIFESTVGMKDGPRCCKQLAAA